MTGHGHQDHGDGSAGERTALYEELVHHLPFSVSAVAIGLVVAGIICFLTPVERDVGPDAEDAAGAKVVEQVGGREASGAGVVEQVGGRETPAASDHAGHDHGTSKEGDPGELVNPFQGLFHLFHPVHMLFSAAATTAMFWRYERRVLKAVVIGLVGAVGVCGLSDIVMPHVSLMLLGKPVAWHICLVENPQMVLTFAVVGVGVGLAASAGVQHSTFFSHSLHVFSSTMASIFYLVGPFGGIAWIDSVGIVFLFIIVAVAVPCCLSDIVFPLFLAGGAHERYRGEHCGGGCEGN